jgi:hypothetical protein
VVRDYELQQPTFHSLMLKKDETKFEVGVYYLSVCTGGDKLSNCHVRLHIPTPRAPGMDYDWCVGLGSQLSLARSRSPAKIANPSREHVGSELKNALSTN